MKTGRNDRCPCGSNKKFKKCCLEASRWTRIKRRIFNEKGIK